jgi:type IV pilus assembly protein PilO
MDLNIDFASLDPNNIGSWPLAARVIVIVLLCSTLLFLGYYLDTSSQLETLDSARSKETKLKEEFEKKQRKAANLDKYKAQMKEMQRTFGALLQQLPGKTEVAEILTDINRTGIQNGLEFELFKPGAENPKEFYAELPIEIRVIGNYHQFGNFVSGVAALPRIVTLHDFEISPQSSAKKEGEEKLIMVTTAKTYRYLDEEQQQSNKDRKQRKSKRKGKR